MLIKSENLISKIEVCAISLFLLMNATSLTIWTRRCVLFRFEESSEYYSRIKKYSHIVTAFVTLTLIVVQTLGIIFSVFTYVNICLEFIFIFLNLVITYKIVKSFQIFEFGEVKGLLIWIYVTCGSVIVSYTVRITINIMSFFNKDEEFPVRSMDLDGKSKLIHFGILTVVELIP